MDFRFTEYQNTVASAVSSLADRFRAAPVHETGFHFYGETLDAEIAAAGFHDVAADPELGSVSAVGVISEIAKLPPSVEIMASTLIRALVAKMSGVEVPRPLALIERPDRPVRFLTKARAALVVQGDSVSLIRLKEGDVAPVESMFAYPYGRLAKAALARAAQLKVDVNELRRVWQIGVAAEIMGALDSALALTSDYVTQRQQFGKPLGTLQAIQHRLAEVAVTSHAIRWLTFRAASSGSGVDAAIACAYAQDAGRQAVYDVHQFHGATGLTLEYSLHLWSYRIRGLLSELGGAGTQSLKAADLAWGVA